MKKQISRTLSILLAVLMLAALVLPASAATPRIIVSTNTLSVGVGETGTITYSTEPAGQSVGVAVVSISHCSFSLKETYVAITGTSVGTDQFNLTMNYNGTKYTELITVNVTAPSTTTHTVTYNYSANGGTSATKTTATVAEGSAIDLTPTATKSGWTFVGWNTNAGATTALSSLTMNTSNVTLYAIYKKTLTATFIDYKGTTKTTRTASVTIYNNETSGIITKPTQNTYTGWTTYCWTTQTTAGVVIEPDGSRLPLIDVGGGSSGSEDTLASNETRIASDVTYYGNYYRTVTLSYNANGGSPTPESQSGTQYANSYDITATQNPTVRLADAISRSGYTFAGWAAGSATGPVFDAGANVEIYNSTKVYATWTPNHPTTHTVTYNYSYNGGTSATKTTATVAEGSAIDLTPTATKSGWTFVGWNTNPNETTKLSSLTMGTSNVTLYAIFKQNVNVYNFGEETYSFINYGDTHGRGHCHGMSLTSAAYYLGRLNPSSIGISSAQYLNTVTDNQTTRNAICYYQAVQGNFTNQSIVAGSITYLNSWRSATQCWNEVVNYVKSHQYDNKGNLQIQIWRVDPSNQYGHSGHAVNFLYYKNVDGQDRLYAYDNNFPTVEVYFYLGSNGMIFEAPKSTYPNKNIESICLVDVNKYFDGAGSYNPSNYVYAKSGEIKIALATAYPMAGDDGMIMFEIPESVSQVTITPLVDNATFEYVDNSYSFNEVDEYTSGILSVVPDSLTPGASSGDSIFTIVRNAPELPSGNNPEAQSSGCPWCGGVHEGFFQKIIGFFHNILAKIFGNKY